MEKIACELDNGVEMRYNELHIAIRLIYFQRTDRGFSCVKSSVYFVQKRKNQRGEKIYAYIYLRYQLG